MSTRVASIVLLLCSVAATHAEPLGRSGGLGAGVHADPLELGPLQVVSSGGAGSGMRVSMGMGVDLGSRWVLRLPVVIAGTGAGAAYDSGYAAIAFVPGALYRFRTTRDQTWVPYVGGGVMLGLWGADRPLLGLPAAPTRAAARGADLDDLFDDDDDDDSSGGGASDPNFEATGGLGLELWGGAEWRPRRWFALALGLTVSTVRVEDVTVLGLAETATLRFSM